jgi:hypothetical protein
MADPNRAALLNMLVLGYEGLRRRLTRRPEALLDLIDDTPDPVQNRCPLFGIML